MKGKQSKYEALSIMNTEYSLEFICFWHYTQLRNTNYFSGFGYRAPDTSRVRDKMVYASSKDRFKRELDGIQVELQATDPSEMSIDIVKSRAI